MAAVDNKYTYCVITIITAVCKWMAAVDNKYTYCVITIITAVSGVSITNILTVLLQL